MQTVEIKIEIFDAEYFTNSKKEHVKIQVKSNFILKIGDKQFAREISNTISIQEKDNPDLLNLLFENGTFSEIQFVKNIL
jgi:hypothetical protein